MPLPAPLFPVPSGGPFPPTNGVCQHGRPTRCTGRTSPEGGWRTHPSSWDSIPVAVKNELYFIRGIKFYTPCGKR